MATNVVLNSYETSSSCDPPRVLMLLIAGYRETVNQEPKSWAQQSEHPLFVVSRLEKRVKKTRESNRQSKLFRGPSLSSWNFA